MLVAVGMLFDPNDYKDDITAAVARATGPAAHARRRPLARVVPDVRIAVGSASLSNAQGFGPEPMAKIGSAELRLALLPLLSGKVQIGQARLTGLELNLARDARGRNNWQDLGGQSAGAAPAPASDAGGGSSIDLGIDSIEIADARVTWNDASTGSRWELTSFALDADDFGLGKKFPLDMRFALAGADVAVKVDASMQATLALAANEYRLEQLDVKVSGSGAGWPGGQGDATLKVDSLAANLAKETLELGGLTLNFLGITMAGSLSGQKLMSDLSLSGAVDIREFNPRDVLSALKVELETADSGVLKSASAKANLLYTSSQLGLRDMQLKLDDSTLTGRVGLEGEKVAYNLAIDDINIDRYLPPSEESGAPADEGSLDAVDLPLDVLRTLNAQGDLKFGKAKFSGLTLTNAAFGLTAANGTLRLTPERVALRRHLRRRHHRDRAERCRANRGEPADRRRGSRAARPRPARLGRRRGHRRREARPRRERLEPRRGSPRARRQRGVHRDERRARRHRLLVRAAARARAARRRRPCPSAATRRGARRSRRCRRPARSRTRCSRTAISKACSTS